MTRKTRRMGMLLLLKRTRRILRMRCLLMKYSTNASKMTNILLGFIFGDSSKAACYGSAP
jgi:hypothetical protein